MECYRELLKSEIENRNSLKKAKTLIIGKKQVITLTKDNIRTTDGNKIIEITTKFYSFLYKEMETKEDEEGITITDEEISEVFVNEIEMTLKRHENGKACVNDGIVTELIKYASRKTWQTLANINTDCQRSRRL